MDKRYSESSRRAERRRCRRYGSSPRTCRGSPSASRPRALGSSCRQTGRVGGSVSHRQDDAVGARARPRAAARDPVGFDRPRATLPAGDRACRGMVVPLLWGRVQPRGVEGAEGGRFFGFSGVTAGATARGRRRRSWSTRSKPSAGCWGRGVSTRASTGSCPTDASCSSRWS
jgi:hypothetical protein